MISPNPDLSPTDRQKVENTINRLDLNDPQHTGMRIKHFQDYIEYPLPSDYLRKYSPFVWLEAQRQELL